MSNIGGTFVEIFNDGGPVMWPLLAFSLLAVIFIIERFFALRRAKINVNEFLTKIRKALLVNRNVKEAIKVCEQSRGPVASATRRIRAGRGPEGRPLPGSR